MTKKYSHNKITIILVIACLSVLSVITGCGGTKVTAGYQLFKLTEGVVHLSFEYPENYTVQRVDVIDDTHEYLEQRIDISLDYVLGSNPNDSEHPVKIKAWINVLGISWDSIDTNGVEELLNRDIEIVQDEMIRANYQLIERSTTTISGLSADTHICSYTVIPTDDEYAGVCSADWVDRRLYLEYDGYIWSISNIITGTVLETDEQHWEHLIKSFHFFD